MSKDLQSFHEWREFIEDIQARSRKGYMKDPYESVREFMVAGGQPVEVGLNEGTVVFHRNRIAEETSEFRIAVWDLGFRLRLNDVSDEALREIAEATFKELLDLVWCCIGFCVAHGWDFTEGFKRLADSNMSKVNPQTGAVEKDARGKILKGPNYTPPKLDDLV